MAPSLNLPIQKLNSYWQINLLRFRVDSKDFLIIIRTPLNSYHFTLSLVYRFSEKLIKNTTNKSNQLIISTEQFERLIFSQKLVGFFKIYMQVVVYSRLFLMYCFKWWKTVMALNSEEESHYTLGEYLVTSIIWGPKMQTFLELNCSCQKLTKTIGKR